MADSVERPEARKRAREGRPDRRRDRPAQLLFFLC